MKKSIIQINQKTKIVLTNNLKINKKLNEIYLRNYEDYKNINKLIIPLKINVYQPDRFFANFNYLKYVSCNPEFLQYIVNKDLIEIFVIPNKVKEIKKEYFQGFKNIKIFEIPNSIEVIEEESFNDLVNVENLSCSFDRMKYFDKKELQ